MARAKSRKKKATRKNKAAKTRRSSYEKEPGYMVRIAEPALVRRDTLESLREVILFMQNYEKFKHVQNEKVRLFSKLRSDLKEINSLLGSKLKIYLPKGKLQGMSQEQEAKEQELEESTTESSRSKRSSKPRMDRPSQTSVASHSELDELESQLQDIESQLKSI